MAVMVQSRWKASVPAPSQARVAEQAAKAEASSAVAQAAAERRAAEERAAEVRCVAVLSEERCTRTLCWAAMRVTCLRIQGTGTRCREVAPGGLVTDHRLQCDLSHHHHRAEIVAS